MLWLATEAEQCLRRVVVYNERGRNACAVQQLVIRVAQRLRRAVARNGRGVVDDTTATPPVASKA